MWGGATGCRGYSVFLAFGGVTPGVAVASDRLPAEVV